MVQEIQTCPRVGVRQSGVTLFEGSNVIDNGTLTINEQCFSWDGQNRQFSVPYQQITLHAISKDPGHHPMDLEDVDEEDGEDDAGNGYIRNPDQFADD
ncbi:hypothetical protein EG68_09961 [Paragonimus skrjabini miyazakii]|uniref:Uncharacterized protein n=1 Tax=Paragonimus skrjabini miyazakii TaxID=59628 RepID=A0A8S9YQK6_9TREM|nr:hypothetical protein EG68_09961 [Paragonimus skrjabini miyazakii]